MATVPRGERRAQAGFTVVELLVTLLVSALLIVGVLTVLDFNNRVTRVQSHVSDMQQSLRIAQYEVVRNLRMAGRGGLPADRALSVRNNEGETGPQGTILVGQPSPAVARGSDVITLRGAFSSTLWQVAYANAGTFDVDLGAGTGTIIVEDPGPTGVPQKLDAIRELLPGGADPAGIPEALLLVSPLSDAQFAVVELDPAGSSVVTVATPTGPRTTATLNFRFTGGTNTGAYQALYPPDPGGAAFPLTSVVHFGILEEYRAYVRDVPLPVGGVGTPSSPKLSLARVWPGTERAYRGNADNLELDIADNILDLQIALGIDTNSDGKVTGQPALAPPVDEWLFNDPADAALVGRVAYVRLNTVARTDRPDPSYRAHRLEPIEDRDYDAAGSTINDPTQLDMLYRRRLLQTVIDLRNIG